MTPFGWWIAIYFSLATLSAGSALGACATIVLRPFEQDRIQKALLYALGAMMMGAGALVLDLERPWDFGLILLNYNPASWISRGSRIITAFSLVMTCLLCFVRSGAARRWLVAGCLPLGGLGALVAVYPAFVLAQEVGRPIWQSTLLVPLFAAGVAHVTALVFGAPRWLELMATILELGLFAAFVASIGLDLVVATPLATSLVVLACVATWLVPTALLFSRTSYVLRVLSIAIGCFGLRASILYLGQVMT